MNRKDVVELLEQISEESVSNLFYNDYEDTEKYSIKEIDSEGGSEGGGEYMMIVLDITNKETNEKVFVKLEGTYNSWDSSDYGDISSFTFVEPKEKVITVYESTSNQDR